MGDFFHLHAHSKFSVLDGMPSVVEMVDKAARMGQPALALTDHGNMSGAYQLYSNTKKVGIAPFIGEEFYVVDFINDENKETKRYHIGLSALDEEGYTTLVKLSSLSHRRDRFHRKPRIDLADLAAIAEAGLGKHLLLTTGCHFGMVVQTLLADGSENISDSSIDAAADLAKMFASWFPHTYVEVQHHGNREDANGIDDDSMVLYLSEIADRAGLPKVITQDAHYCDSQDRSLHNLMKRIGYYGSASDSNERDWTFPGDRYHLASEEWVKAHYQALPEIEDVWKESQSSMRAILALNKMKLAPLDNYTYHVPKVTNDPQSRVERLCRRAMEKRGLARRKIYSDRLQHELSVIADLSMADYFCLVLDYCQEARRRGILINARGSANGSLVCWLLDITGVDPVQWGLVFERFLSRDRTKPPDIDVDIDKFRRQELIDYIGSKYQIVPIGTYGKLGEDEETGSGSLWVLWMQKRRNELPKEKYQRIYGNMHGLRDLDRIIPSTSARLSRLAEKSVYKSAGTHAAGYLVSAESRPITEYMPTMLIPSSDITVTQMMMDDCEDAGYIKIDLLGLRSLATVYFTLLEIGQDPLKPLDWIPLDDSKVFSLLRQGRTNTGVFQFEGWTAAKGCREVRVRSIHDLVLVNALYRPATIGVGSVAAFIRNRRDPGAIAYPHPIMREVLSPTFGIAVFQEQVLELLRRIGVSVEDFNSLLKAIKHAKALTTSQETQAVFHALKTRLEKAAANAGFDQHAIDVLMEMIEGFTTYGFNKAHATAYGLLGYRMAWLKVNHPLEFHASLLRTLAMAGDKREPIYASEARRCGVTLAAPHINKSDSAWAIDGNKVRRGLLTIKGIGDALASCIVDARKHEGEFASIDDLVERSSDYLGRALPGGKEWISKRQASGAIKALMDVGALSGLK